MAKHPLYRPLVLDAVSSGAVLMDFGCCMVRVLEAGGGGWRGRMEGAQAPWMIKPSAPHLYGIW